MSLLLTQLGGDDFNRPNENPLTPTKWTGVSDGYLALQVVSHACRGVSTVSTSLENYTEVDCGQDQWCQVQVNITPGSFSGMDVSVRMETAPDPDSDYDLELFDLGDHYSLQMFRYNDYAPTLLYDNQNFAFVNGDTIGLAAVGTTLYALHNGSIIATIVDSGPDVLMSGPPGLFVSEVTAVSDVTLTNFTCGSASITSSVSSVVDSRAITTLTPNSSRTLQQTVIYDVPKSTSLRNWFNTSFTRSLNLPEDSRSSDPTDSRNTSYIPENSRS